MTKIDEYVADFISDELLEKMSDPEIRAVASDRGYNLNDMVSSARLRIKFKAAQAKDFLARG
jgi:hypothetical protein